MDRIDCLKKPVDVKHNEVMLQVSPEKHLLKTTELLSQVFVLREKNALHEKESYYHSTKPVLRNKALPFCNIAKLKQMIKQNNSFPYKKKY